MAIKFRKVETVNDTESRGGNHRKPHGVPKHGSGKSGFRKMHIYEAYDDGKKYDTKGKR